MSWRLARSLVTFRDQVNKKWPTRDKSWDGTIGDTAHAARKSDHNPDSDGVVKAIDITHDPAHGLNAGVLAESLRMSKDDRIAYIIWNRHISNPDIDGGAWRRYDGKNPHDHHMHLSVKKAYCDLEGAWAGIGNAISIDAPTGIPAPPLPLLRYGMRGPAVSVLQRLLGIKPTTYFDDTTVKAVKAFQQSTKIVDDGIVGIYTWTALVQPTGEGK